MQVLLDGHPLAVACSSLAEALAVATVDAEKRGRIIVEVKADGKVGLLRVEYRPWDKSVDISHVLKAGQDGSDIAKSFTILGLAEPPKVTLNGRPAEVRTAGSVFQVSLA